MEPELERIKTFDISKDAKSRLQEYIQSSYGKTPRYRTHVSTGPDHARFYTQKVSVKRLVLGVGQGYSKQEADQLAAAMALYRLGEPAPEHDPDDDLINQFELGDVDDLTGD
jgi:ribonuclease-3